MAPTSTPADEDDLEANTDDLAVARLSEDMDVFDEADAAELIERLRASVALPD